MSGSKDWHSFDRMRQTKLFLIPIINNYIQFEIDKPYGNGKERIYPHITARTLFDTHNPVTWRRAGQVLNTRN